MKISQVFTVIWKRTFTVFSLLGVWVLKLQHNTRHAALVMELVFLMLIDLIHPITFIN